VSTAIVQFLVPRRPLITMWTFFFDAHFVVLAAQK
jgi:hypothetical protein